MFLGVLFSGLQPTEIAFDVFTEERGWSYSSSFDAECVEAALKPSNSRHEISLSFHLLGVLGSLPAPRDTQQHVVCEARSLRC